MRKNKYTVKEIAKWFITRAAYDVEMGGEYLTQLKLQKLLYYAKGFYFVFENEPLFNAKMSAQPYGPVVNSLIPDLKKYGNSFIENEFSTEVNIEDPVVLNILEFVYKKVGKFSAYTLVGFTHTETPWCEREKKQEITDDSISDYFREEYLENSKDNKFDISDREIYSIITENNLIKYREAFENLAK